MTKPQKNRNIDKKRDVAISRRSVGGGSVDIPPPVLAAWRDLAGVGDEARMRRNQTRFKELWRIFTSRRDQITAELLADPRDAEAYLTGFHLPNAARATLLVRRLVQRAGVKRLADLFAADFQHQRIFDLGCGSGAWSQVWLSELQLARNSVHLIDASDSLLAIAAEGLARVKKSFASRAASPSVYVDAVPGMLDQIDFDLFESHQATADHAARTPERKGNATLDVCILGYVWNELVLDPRAKKRVFDRLVDYARSSKDALLLLAEPATDEMAWGAMELRDSLCREGWVSLYPCSPSVAECPMLAEPLAGHQPRRDWCFSEGAWRKPVAYAQIESATGIAHTKLNSALFVMASPELARKLFRRAPALGADVSVVVGKPTAPAGRGGKKAPPGFSYLICSKDGLGKTPPKRIDPKYAKPRGSLVKLGLFLLMFLPLAGVFGGSLISCGRKGEVPITEKPKNPDLVPPYAPAFASLDVLGAKPLARRLAFDLNDSLESTAIEGVIAASGTAAGVNIAMQSPRFPQAASRYLAAAMGVRGNALADLDHLALTDSGLSSTLTPAMKSMIAAEANLFFEVLLRDDQRDLNEIFRGSSSVADPSVVTLWGKTAGAPSFPGRSEVGFNYADGRPAMGILSTQAFVASGGTLGGAADHPEDRPGARILEQLRCTSMSAADAHDFSALDTSSLSASGLAALKTSSSSCRGCHVPVQAAGKLLLGTANAGGMAAYRSFDGSAGGNFPAHWFGSATASWSDLSANLFADEALRTCLSQRVLESLVQRPANPERDGARMSIIAAYGMAGDGSVAEWFGGIVKSPANTAGATLSNSKVSSAEAAVRKTRWRDPAKLLTALRQQAPLAAPALDSMMAKASVNSGFSSSSSSYPLRIDYAGDVWEYGVGAASAIVAAEFAPGVTQGQRGVFSSISDPATIDAASGAAAMATIWEKWTGNAPTSARRSDLESLYAEAIAASSSVQPELDGLTAMLASLIVSPLFLAY